MVTSVTKSSIISDVWKNFFDRIKSEVTTVTLSTGTVVTIPTTSYTASFPDNLIDSKSDYPIIVVEDPIISTDALTSGKTLMNGTIRISLYTTQAEAGSKLLGLINNSIETYKSDLSTVGIRNVEIADTAQDSNTRDKIKLHYREVTFTFEFYYSKTGGY